MKLEEIKNKTQEATDYLVHSLEAGHSEVLTEYLGAMAKFHTYSFGNIMWLFCGILSRTEDLMQLTDQDYSCASRTPPSL
jgi:hypothetical protein